MKNGLEITFIANVFRDLTEDYPVKREIKMTANNFLKAIEKDLDKEFERVYNIDPQFTINILQKIKELSSTVAKMDTHELILFADFAKKFYDNREIVKEKGQSFFNKII